MLGRLDHVAIAVADLEAASTLYRDRFGARVSEPHALPEHGVRVVFVDLPNIRIELIAPLGDQSSIAKFVDSHPRGAIHHLCFEVENIASAQQKFMESGGHVLGSGCPVRGAHDKKVIFLDPRDCAGVLIELEEA
jgi:methylmalonyl-CoA/ethylmalonyl-CoA epimerase